MTYHDYVSMHLHLHLQHYIFFNFRFFIVAWSSACIWLYWFLNLQHSFWQLYNISWYRCLNCHSFKLSDISGHLSGDFLQKKWWITLRPNLCIFYFFIIKILRGGNSVSKGTCVRLLILILSTPRCSVHFFPFHASHRSSFQC